METDRVTNIQTATQVNPLRFRSALIAEQSRDSVGEFYRLAEMNGLSSCFYHYSLLHCV